MPDNFAPINFLPPQPATIAVGISGGVDSSVAALLLRDAGYDVFAVFMNNWQDDIGNSFCRAQEDLQDAQQVCDALQIKLHVVNFSAAYQQRVFALFLKEYAAGRTPNPDVLCNREIKFAELLDFVRGKGADYLATGHYARRVAVDGKNMLLKARDNEKDQSYFLNQIKRKQLASAIFPLGDIDKNEVRKLAQRARLVTFDKKDSTGICFIGERPFRQFLQSYLPAQRGIIRSENGDNLGTHQGLMFYTIGQRQGLGIGGRAGQGEGAWYVVDKDIKNNELIVARGDSPLLFHSFLQLEDCAWLNDAPCENRFYTAKIRHRQRDQPCRLQKIDAIWNVAFSSAQRAVTTGQYLAVYDGDICLGGGVICKRS